MKRCLIECGVRQASEEGALAMNVSDPGKNVNLRIESISRSMVGNIPDLLIDLLEIAAYVYCVDQRIKRGTEMLMDYGKDWRRSLTFSIPVRHPEVWNEEEVQELLVKTLGFLSDDSYAFRFRKAEAPVQPRDPYFHELLDAFQENDEVALFSGGVDSFAGAVNDIVTLGKSVTLVGHWSVPKVQNVQATLVDALKQRGYPRRKAASWWRERVPELEVPESVDEALILADQVRRPTEIAVRPAGRFTEITAYRFAPCLTAVPGSAPSAIENPAAGAGSTRASASPTRGATRAAETSAAGFARTSATGGRA